MDRGAAASIARVSAREAEVLAGIGERLTNAEIAGRLFISVRTVESHVSALLRKLGANDRRALAGMAADLAAAPRAGALPSSLTPLVGRAAERAALTAALRDHRLVTAVGPGGVGKTRLALAVAAELGDRFADGVWYVDLVPVTDGAMVAPAVAYLLGLGEQPGRSAEETVLAWLADREVLLVLDNCEHLVDGVVVMLERLLTRCPGVRVLAVGRARLLVPYERVFLVPGLSVEGDGGDAVELFLARAAASGGLGSAAFVERPRVAAICRGLDGMALAIELAAARLPALGLDGLEAGLDDRLRLLTGGRRVDDRHRSLRSALDWSHALLTVPERAVLRRTSVFATPFTADAASALLTGWPPTDVPAPAAAALGALADQSLLTAIPDPGGTRYQALETIRQYGTGHLRDAGELPEARARHLRWCLATADELDASFAPDAAGWRARFDRAVDELRAALDWASTEPGRRAEAYRLAVRLAEVCYLRGLPGEAQRRYEQAGALAADDRQAAGVLHCAAEAAKARHFGTEGLRLHRAAAEAALRAGDHSRAAYDVAQIAELLNRGPGVLSEPVAPGAAERLIAEADALAGDDPRARARLLVARTYAVAEDDPATPGLLDRAIALSREAGDPLGESAALDQLTGFQLVRGEIRAAAASALRRIELLAPLPLRADTCGLELSDAYFMATECVIAAGDLTTGRRLAEQARDLPFHREEGHLATARLLLVTALAGDWDETVALSERFREGWERAGRPRAGNLSRGPYALATVYGFRGDDDARNAWLAIAEALTTPGRTTAQIHHGEFFDALLLLHHGRPDEAVARLTTPPEEFRTWYSGLWRPWYAAVWAEAAALSGHPDAAERLARARRSAVDNPIALAVVERSAAVATGDRKGVLAAAEQLHPTGCRYQWARSLVLAGGPERARGADELTRMGATPMRTAGLDLTDEPPGPG
ncbi:ATP-binding protein [Cryptosporangium aurantiacum]|uniref:Predicted ATPase n=1 Tax=Cryptosporangium aurantiacum TaxID=134849 RepID=A0A1M7L3N1_9ACTN|nr:LuxR C-terminal-related transcriptional regulator [Cryptosporangium aurantiacum]SHM72465.1 Predicted ATPase [Cryptosporangium aurantiacum]